MNSLEQLRTLVRRQPDAPRWPYFVPGLAALLFVRHALEDAGWTGAAPYIAVLAVSAIGVLRPTILGWGLLVVPLVAYGGVVAMSVANGPLDEWAVFMAMGFGPVLLLWLGRPWGRRKPGSDAQQQT